MASQSILFDGIYKDLWKKIVPEGLTRLEIDFLIEISKIPAGSRVLDLMSGYGRHTIPLANLGMLVTSVDNSTAYTDEIKTRIESGQVEVLNQDAREFSATNKHDLAICMGNSISSFDKAETEGIFRRVNENLVDNGTFVLNTWMLSEIVFAKVHEREWFQIEDFKYLLHNRFLFQPTRIETDHTVTSPSGEVETKVDVDFILSIAEVIEMLERSSFKISGIYSTPKGKRFSIGDQYCYFVATKK